jgi:hypothetical protein
VLPMNLTILSLRSGMTNIMAGRSRRVKCADLMFRSGAGLIFRAFAARSVIRKWLLATKLRKGSGV